MPLTTVEEAYYVALIRKVRALGVSFDCIEQVMVAIKSEDTLGMLQGFMARSRRPADRRAYQSAIDVQLREGKQ